MRAISRAIDRPLMRRCTPGTLAALKPGEPAQVATSLVVREDSLTLYGFSSDDERNVFELLQTASGVGPRLALAMLAVHAMTDAFTAAGFRIAVVSEPEPAPAGRELFPDDLATKPRFLCFLFFVLQAG